MRISGRDDVSTRYFSSRQASARQTIFDELQGVHSQVFAVSAMRVLEQD
jgi:hypothetical protein